MFKVTVNNQYTFEIADDLSTANNAPLTLDISSGKADHQHIIHHHQSFQTELVSVDEKSKTAQVKVNGRIYNVEIEDDLDGLLKAMGMTSRAGKAEKVIRAPMPGLVLEVKVSVGQQISKGDNLLILEAMKMENMLKASSDGIIDSILAMKGDKVEKNQLLIRLA